MTQAASGQVKRVVSWRACSGQQQGDISPTVVAGGIKIALITTVTGLMVAIILQIFYNYLVSQIDNIVNKMEDASISLIDILVKYNLKK